MGHPANGRLCPPPSPVTHVYVRTYVCMCVHMLTCMYIYIYICMHMRIYIQVLQYGIYLYQVYTHIYTDIHIHWHVRKYDSAFVSALLGGWLTWLFCIYCFSFCLEQDFLSGVKG